MKLDRRVIWALITIAIYAFFFHSIWVALLIAGAVSWHEMSHLWAAKKMGLKTLGFTLYPFIGGVATVDDRYKTYGQQSFVVLAGPMGGGLGAIATAILYVVLYKFFHLDLGWLCAAAYWMCFLNLFNLLPLSFMDGGQLMNTMTYSINRTLGVFCYGISTLVAAALFAFMAPVLAMFIAFMGGISLMAEFKNWQAWRKGQTWLCSDSWNNPPQRLTILQGLATAFLWVITIVVLAGTMVYLKHTSDYASISYLFKR